jgi:hypothetical protein
LRIPVLTRLLPIVAALTLLGQPVAAYAGAGIIYGDMFCCCPDREHCKCRGEDGPSPEQEMRRCVDQAKLVAPVVLPMVPAPRLAIEPEPRETERPALPLPPLPESRVVVPDVPPF